MTLGTMLLWMVVLMYGVPAGIAAWQYPDVAWMIVGPICWWTLILVVVVVVCLWLARIESQPERSSS
jgi:hypothetical protein